MGPKVAGVFALGVIPFVPLCGTKGDDTADTGYHYTTGTMVGTSSFIGTGVTTGWTGTTTTTGTMAPRMEVQLHWSSSSTTGTVPTTGTPVPTGPACADQLDIAIYDSDGQGPYQLGLVDSGTGGWTGEDCGIATGSVCHDIDSFDLLQQVPDCDPASVVPGSTTAFSADDQAALTYVLFDDSQGDCFVMGADPAYYSVLGCDQL